MTEPLPRRWLRRAFIGYILSALTVWLIVYLGGDRWWPATVVLFGPRWLLLVPLAVMVPLSPAFHRRLLLAVLPALVFLTWKFAGFCFPMWPANSTGIPLSILTCNIQSGNLISARLASLIAESRADIVALQECPQNLKLDLPTGWHVVREGEFAVASRFPLQRGAVFSALHPPHKWPRTSMLQCTVKMPIGDLTFCTVHLPSPRYGLQHILDRRTIISLTRKDLLVQETEHRRRVAREVAQTVAKLPAPVIIAGDFNMPSESTIFRESWSEYVDAFSARGIGFGSTVRAHIAGIQLAARVDHILLGKGVVARSCKVGQEVGSDHLPVIAEIGLQR